MEFPLAYWAMGQLAQREFEEKWKIPALHDKSKEELLEMAIIYYEKAAEQELAKAFRSLGNLACNEKVDDKIRKRIGPFKEYYLLAADGKDVYGLYNYGRTLEKEINERISKHKGPGVVWRNAEKNTVQKMLKCFEESAELGYPLANYRCALYYGELSDEKSIPLEERKDLSIEKDNGKAVEFFKRILRSQDNFSMFNV